MSESAWDKVGELTEDYFEKARSFSARMDKVGVGSVPELLWYNPDTLAWSKPLPEGFGKEAWVPVKTGSALRPLFSALQLAPNSLNQLVGGPTPLAASLAGGLLGAGLGYAGGWVGEKVMGDKVLRPGRLRRTAAILGGLLGAAPGAYLGTVDMRANAQEGKSPWRAWIEPNRLFGAAPHYPPMETQASLREKAAGLDDVLEVEVNPLFLKVAEDAGAIYMPMIPVDAFNRTVWQDPNTSMPMRAAVTGLVEAASQSRGGVEMISPFDVGRIAIGMGSGLASGLVVGKVLGALAGLTPGAQSVLQQTGMWAGALANVVPRVFGYRL